jgi:hypothetical protein
MASFYNNSAQKEFGHCTVPSCIMELKPMSVSMQDERRNQRADPRCYFR